MKKYCFTQCFKTKMQKFKEGLIFAFMLFSMAIGIIILIPIITGIIGLITQAIYVGIFGSLVGLSPYIIESAAYGLIIIIYAAISVMIISWLYKTFKNFITGIYKFGTHTLKVATGVDKFECKIFEECK